MKALPGRPARSPDLNPAENMWPALKKAMKPMEKKSDKFTDFRGKMIRTARMYPSSEKLVRAMAGRMHECCKRYVCPFDIMFLFRFSFCETRWFDKSNACPTNIMPFLRFFMIR